MKKILIAAVAALCFASNSFSQENAGGAGASNSASGNVDEPKIVAGAVGITLLAAMIANNRGSTKSTPIDPGPTCGADEKLENGICVPIEPTDPVCEADEDLVDGVCVPVTTTTTVTNTVTATNTVTNTNTTSVTVTTTL